MVNESVGFDANKMVDIQKDVIYFERLIDDLIGILSKSISFCIHSGESINELVKQSVRNCEGMNDKNGDDPIYSLPKRITNSLVGSYLYEYSQENKRNIFGEIYLDYNGDETLFPLLIDSLMNKKVNIDKLELRDQLDLLRMFDYCNLPMPEEFVKYPYRFRNNHVVKQYKEGNDVILYINDKKDDRLKEFLKKNGLWNKIVGEYGDGYVDYNEKNNEMFIKINFEYIDYIYEYIQYNCIYISEEKTKTVNRELLENEMYSLFGDKGKEKVKEGMEQRWFKGSNIIFNKVLDTSLVNWLGKEKKWKLLFRASEHDYSASEFHRYCDNKGETVTIIEHIGYNNHINIFGGYTNQSWAGSGYKFYSKGFLFTLTNEHGIPPTKYDYINSDRSKAIYCYSSYGPIFGGGHDIKISDQCYSNTDSYCNAHSYSEVSTPQKHSLFVNTNDSNSGNSFTVEDYEVWGRI
ncbi:hypothetical protein WA158_005905 [Blastocystis sp. Blastoise]